MPDWKINKQAAASLGVRDVLGWGSPDLDDFRKKIYDWWSQIGVEKERKK